MPTIRNVTKTTSLPPLFKVLTRYGDSNYRGYQYDLPRGNRPGAWMKVTGKLEECRNGLHVTTYEHLVSWLTDATTNRVFLVETRGKVVKADYKYVCQELRLVREVFIPKPTKRKPPTKTEILNDIKAFITKNVNKLAKEYFDNEGYASDLPDNLLNKIDEYRYPPADDDTAYWGDATWTEFKKFNKL